MRRHSWDLLAVIVVSLFALAVAALSSGPNPALTIASLPLALVLPGYALVALLLPYAHLGFPERVALSVGVSIAVTVMAGLLLHALRIPIAGASWRILLSGLTIAVASYGVLRRTQGKLAPPGTLAAQATPREAVVLSVGALVIGLALGLSGIGVAAAPGEPFTEFWALGEQSGTRQVVRVGLRNEEGLPVTYRVAVQAGDRLLAEWPRVTLAANAMWRAEATVPPSLYAQEIIATAHRSGDAEDGPYRYARVVIEGSDKP